MKVLSASEAKANFQRLINETAESHEPVQIRGTRGNAVLVSEDDWRSIQETLYLLSVPGVGRSITDGMKTPLSKCRKELKRS